MNNNVLHIFKPLIESLSVGSPIQNMLFYSFILFLLLVNIFLVRRKRGALMNPLAVDDEIDTDEKLPSYEYLYQQIKNLEAVNASLKTELLTLGEELELSYNKYDRLNYQLTDILECLELTVSYDEKLWDWSIDPSSGELTLSEYGLRVRGYTPGTKLTWNDALNLVSDDYRKQVETALNISLNTGADFTMVYKIMPINGTRERWVRSFGKMIFRDDGTSLRLEGKFTFTLNEQLLT